MSEQSRVRRPPMPGLLDNVRAETAQAHCTVSAAASDSVLSQLHGAHCGRVCVGNHFALVEASIVLRTLLRGYSFSRLQDVELAPSITLRPRPGVMLQVDAL